jgi:phosphoribosyl-ATP pyrophosphohydrolase/phosphoribosyl-AMP cyclohydrolase/histidinol dehydrogenase
VLKIIEASSFEPTNLFTPIDDATIKTAGEIVNSVRSQGITAIQRLAEQFGERIQGQPLLIERDQLEAATARIDSNDLELLKRVAKRIRTFADAQLSCLSELKTPVPGGFAGHTIQPINRVGCYAPAGRFALPSTALMTIVPAVAAGCPSLVLATPNPSDMMLATAFIAGANQVLAIGGAHAVAALAYGFEGFEKVDLIAGPGNRWVTAAKKIVNGDCGIDMLAGPSELVLVADETGKPETIAADLLAQAEHDIDARPFLLTTSREMAELVNAQIQTQLTALPTGKIAQQAIQNGGAIIVETLQQAVEICNALAPEHLELHCEDAEAIASQIKHAGCIFIGHQSAEVFGDYGVGPNHTLPTAGTARWSGGLNVFTYTRVRTYLQLSNVPDSLVQDTARLAEIEGLIGHQQASLRRQHENR